MGQDDHAQGRRGHVVVGSSVNGIVILRAGYRHGGRRSRCRQLLQVPGHAVETDEKVPADLWLRRRRVAGSRAAVSFLPLSLPLAWGGRDMGAAVLSQRREQAWRWLAGEIV